MSRHVSAQVSHGPERGLVFISDAADHSLGRRLYVSGRRPEWRVLGGAIEALAARGVAPGGVFVDVGANIGTTSLSALRHGFERVVAFEPSAANRRLLLANGCLNGVEDRLDVYPQALSDVVGQSPFEMRRAKGALGRIVDSPPPGDRAGLVTMVETTTLDVLIEQGVLDPSRIGMLWIDTEGHELRVLSGARRLLAEHFPPIVLEWGPKRLSANAVQSLIACLPDAYTRVVDLRRSDPTAPRSISELPAVLASYDRSRGTDLLIFA